MILAFLITLVIVASAGVTAVVVLWRQRNAARTAIANMLGIRSIVVLCVGCANGFVAIFRDGISIGPDVTLTVLPRVRAR